MELLFFTIFTFLVALFLFLIVLAGDHIISRIKNYFERRDDIETLDEKIHGHPRPIRHISDQEAQYLSKILYSQRRKQFWAAVFLILAIVLCWYTSRDPAISTLSITSLSTQSGQAAIFCFFFFFSFLFPQSGRVYLDLRSPVFATHGMLNKWEHKKKSSVIRYLGIRDLIFKLNQPEISNKFDEYYENKITYIEYSPWTKTIWKIEQF